MAQEKEKRALTSATDYKFGGLILDEAHQARNPPIYVGEVLREWRISALTTQHQASNPDYAQVFTWISRSDVELLEYPWRISSNLMSVA
jgi:hypothetical protein